MGEAPSLFTLCMESVAMELVRGDDLLPDIYELPLDLFDCLLTSLPPLALQKLQEQLSFSNWNDYESTNDCFENQRKRKRCLNFEIAWRALYKSRWPGLRIYWETHLQDCLDAAAEKALLPSFDGCIGEIKVPDAVLKYIGCGVHLSNITRDCSKLSYHFRHFGSYARCLKLQNVLCAAETCLLLRTSKLESLELRWIKSNEHVVGLCKLLDQNSETLTSIEFIHCKLSSTFVDAICDSLHIKGLQTHGVKHFSIKTSSFMEINSLPLPVGLASFLSSGRSLTLLSLSDNNLQQNFAKMVLNTLLDASSSIVILDLSENNIAGWLSDFKWRSTSCSKLYSGIGKSLQSLRVLNLRNTNLQKDDADCLIYALVHMPNLGTLDLSDNPIEDDGMKSLISYFVEISEREPPFAELKLENCELTCKGVSQLLGVLSQLKKPLNALSIGDNDLGIKVGAPLGKYLCTGIRSLNIEDIGLCSSGFLEAQEELMEELKLVYINISKNRGGIETAKFLSKLISQSPRLVAVNAGYNFMPVESLSAICSGLKVAKGKLEHLDLTGNSFCDQSAEASVLAGFQIHGKPIIVLSSLPASNQPYDDDP
ncbi:unnamed protein product [Ilex paraguariensis]|uniref:Uncharacterized protein n=1 Tax=Ilex paraguariensis TaxID=185542 RepID=A0ABC8SNP8_9AQUA